MWFAFKLYLWRIEKQRSCLCFLRLCCCDLLSNCIFDVLKNNFFFLTRKGSSVVICFQIVSLTYWKTTSIVRNKIIPTLWFAFKLYLWRIEKQPPSAEIFPSTSCDLLSNCIFDVLKNNVLLYSFCNCIVVICFQIVSLTYWKTTQAVQHAEYFGLWFAFKLYLWRIEKQLFFVRRLYFHCCDLLSNCIFDVLKNNKLKYGAMRWVVVICFQIVSLTYWKTTCIKAVRVIARLWFAFKLYLWRIEKQLNY